MRVLLVLHVKTPQKRRLDAEGEKQLSIAFGTDKLTYDEELGAYLAGPIVSTLRSTLKEMNYLTNLQRDVHKRTGLLNAGVEYSDQDGNVIDPMTGKRLT